jgi:hypothetical protein
MRQGRSPQDACREAVERIAQAPAGGKTLQVGFIALAPAASAVTRCSPASTPFAMPATTSG